MSTLVPSESVIYLDPVLLVPALKLGRGFPYFLLGDAVNGTMGTLMVFTYTTHTYICTSMYTYSSPPHDQKHMSGLHGKVRPLEMQSKQLSVCAAPRP